MEFNIKDSEEEQGSKWNQRESLKYMQATSKVYIKV